MASRRSSRGPVAGAFGLGLGLGFLLGFLLPEARSRRGEEKGVLLDRIAAGLPGEPGGDTAGGFVSGGVELQPLRVPPAQAPSTSPVPRG
jgi:hypothetical protein